MDQNIGSKKKLTIIISAFSVLILFIFLFIKFSNKSTQNKPVSPMGNQKVDQRILSSLKKATIGETTETNLGFSFGLKTKNKIDSERTKYSFKSSLPQRDNEVITESGVAVFERTVLPEKVQKDELRLITDFENQFGKAEKILPGSRFYGPDVSTYIYSKLGFSFIANTFTKEVYEIHTFRPTTPDKYTDSYGNDIYLEIPADEGSLQPNKGSVQAAQTGLGTDKYGTSAFESVNSRINGNKIAFLKDTLCLINPLCGLSAGDQNVDDCDGTTQCLQNGKCELLETFDECSTDCPAGQSHNVSRIRDPNREPAGICGYTVNSECKPDPTCNEPGASPVPEPPKPGTPQPTPCPKEKRTLTYYIPFRDTLVRPTTDRKTALEGFPHAVEKYWDTIVEQATDKGWNPAFVLAIWIEETGGSQKTLERVGGAGMCPEPKERYCAKGHLGCAPRQEQTIDGSLSCLFNPKNPFQRLDNDKFKEFMAKYSGGPADDPFSNNCNFVGGIKSRYDRLVPPNAYGSSTPADPYP